MAKLAALSLNMAGHMVREFAQVGLRDAEDTASYFFQEGVLHVFFQAPYVP